MEGVGAGTLTPAPESERVRAQTAGEFAPGQPGRLLQLLQPLGQVLRGDVSLAAVVRATRSGRDDDGASIAPLTASQYLPVVRTG